MKLLQLPLQVNHDTDQCRRLQSIFNAIATVRLRQHPRVDITARLQMSADHHLFVAARHLAGHLRYEQRLTGVGDTAQAVFAEQAQLQLKFERTPGSAAESLL